MSLMSALPGCLRCLAPGLALLLAATPAASAGTGDEVTADDPAGRITPMAGMFFGSLPLGSCPQADALLRLGEDQRYTLQAHCRATLEDLPVERGTWSAEWNGTCVRLVSGADATTAREFAVPLDSMLVLATGSCIEPVEDPRGRSLHRAQPWPSAD